MASSGDRDSGDNFDGQDTDGETGRQTLSALGGR